MVKFAIFVEQDVWKMEDFEICKQIPLTNIYTLTVNGIFSQRVFFFLWEELPAFLMLQNLICYVFIYFLQAWCVTGNCFSLQKEHDTAIKFFQRAIQVRILMALI